MPSSLDPIPNSNGVSTVLNLFSYCYTFLKNARPLSQSAHAVTSLITPQVGASPSFKAPPLLLAAGAAALLGVAYLFKTRVIPHFFPKHPPADLSQKDTTIVTPSDAPSNHAGGAGAAPAPVGGQEGAGLPPPPVVHPVSVSAAPPAGGDQREAALPPPPSSHVDVTAPLPPSNSEQSVKPLPPSPASRDHAEPPPAVKPPSPLPTSSSSPSLSTEEERLAREPIAPRHSLPLVEPAAMSSDSSTSPASSERLSPSSSPPSKTDESDSSSGSEPETHSPSLPQRPTAMERVMGAVTSFVTNTRHFSKWTKYRLIQEQLESFARERNIDYYRTERDASKADVEITDDWNQLVTALLEPTRFPSADDQYRATVKCLRKIRQMLVSADVEVQQKFSRQFQFVRELSYVRFAGIELFPYCQQLIELVSKIPLPAHLTLENFQQELKARTTVLNKPDASHGMNGAACLANKAKGTLGIYFDPLLKSSNIPYQDGIISVNGRATLLLWHGTPITQHDPYGLAYDIVAGALSYIPFLGKWIPNTNPVSSPPVINGDYVAYTEHAGVEGKNILEVILEKGEKERVRDESGRVKTRMREGIYHRNKFVMALRLDGEFFERHDIGRTAVEPMQSLKRRLAEQLLLMPPLEQEDMTLSTFQRRQMEDQLAANGFCIPQKLRDASQLPEHMDRLLNEVQEIYFSGVENITTQEQHQAFVILSYVHIILFICEKINVGILEALCKDDKDRGNVIKTILKLHFLYLTGQINHETLTSVLVHTLARPFILQKNAIIKSRLVLLERVIPFIKAARDRIPVPKTFIFGKPIESAYYRVAKPAGQTILPSNDASKTIEEYVAFLENPSPIPIVYNGNLIEELSGNCYPAGRRQDEFIQHTISAGARTMNILVGGSILKAPPGPSVEQEAAYYQTGVHTSILTYLRDTCKLSEEEAWKISCAFQPVLGQALRGQLNSLFTNRVLGISIKLDEQSLGAVGCGMNLTHENGAPKIKFDAIYNISDRNTLIARVKVSLTMADARTGQSQLTYALV